MRPEFPTARSGQPLTPSLWNAARAFVHAQRIIAGPGIRITRTPFGSIIAARRAGKPWTHPFQVSLAGTGATIETGFVNLIEPRIDDVPLSGSDREGAPVLRWPKLSLDADGRGYIALELETDEKFAIVPAKVKIVQVAYFDSADGTEPPKTTGGKSASGGVPLLPGRRARWPLAMLRQRKNGTVDLFQVTHGDLQFRAEPAAGDDGTGRAFFW
jgi:hypothetical protein